jgi:hypothetical protein
MFAGRSLLGGVREAQGQLGSPSLLDLSRWLRLRRESSIQDGRFFQRWFLPAMAVRGLWFF